VLGGHGGTGVKDLKLVLRLRAGAGRGGQFVSTAPRPLSGSENWFLFGVKNGRGTKSPSSRAARWEERSFKIKLLLLLEEGELSSGLQRESTQLVLHILSQKDTEPIRRVDVRRGKTVVLLPLDVRWR